MARVPHESNRHPCRSRGMGGNEIIARRLYRAHRVQELRNLHARENRKITKPARLRRLVTKSFAIEGNARGSSETTGQIGFDIAMEPFGRPVLRSRHQGILWKRSD